MIYGGHISGNLSIVLLLAIFFRSSDTTAIYISAHLPANADGISSTSCPSLRKIARLERFHHKLFLKSDKLEERMLALLGHMQPEENIPILEKLLIDIKDTAKDSLSTDRYVQQLHVLVNLRNLGQNLEQAMMTISKYFKEEEDLLFRAGQRKGRQAERAKAEQEKKEMAREMARKMIDAKEPLNKIIEYTGLPIEEIQSL